MGMLIYVLGTALGFWGASVNKIDKILLMVFMF